VALHTVKIEINASGTGLKPIADEHVNPNRKGEKLCFKCDDGEFAVLFANDRSPYVSGKKAHAAHKTETTAQLKVRNLTAAEQKKPVGDPVNGATFKYGVAVLHPGTGKVLTLDPDIIIDDPGGH
jgi:hypothetical protein